MRICHLCLHGPYNEGWNYQENILPKYHSLQGHEVYQIVTPYMWDQDKIAISTDTEYTNKNGVNIIRCKHSKGPTFGGRITHYPEVMDLLTKINPGILFIHDVQCIDIRTVVKYLKTHQNCIVYVDNHSDFSNSARNWVSKNILHKMLWKHMAKIINPYVKRFYGVLPARVDFLVDMYGLPKEKCSLLVMGADDERVEENLLKERIAITRAELNIEDEEFLIVTGGKIDLAKTQTLLLMEAVRSIQKNIKLVVFGSVALELKERFNELCDSDNIKYIGWIPAEDSYRIFSAADLVMFPGRHSVFWEQVAGMGIPMVVKYWDGTTHVDCGGNVEFLYNDSVEEIILMIEKITQSDYHHKMKKTAENASGNFRYSTIAKKSIEMIGDN